ncbi:MAG: GntR family transcriptional regulator [Hyphomicrobiaceae bacterium]|nr:GntR family transcriptional regulator [Hyphomicrobiaceae bacterium]
MAEIALDTLEKCILAEAQRSRAPKHRCVFEAFEKCIRSGRFKPGERVPAEIELTERLPVGLGTLQKALTKLAERGLVVRNRKTGTYIADRRSQVTEVYVYRFKDPETGELLMPFVRALSVTVEDAPGPWQTALNVERYVRIDRLVWVEQDPPAFSSLFLSYEHGRDLLNMPVEELHGSSCHRVLIERFNLPTLRMEHKVRCRALSDRACDHLRLSPATAGLVWDVKDFSFDDMPNLFQRFEMPPGHRPMELEETISG